MRYEERVGDMLLFVRNSSVSSALVTLSFGNAVCSVTMIFTHFTDLWLISRTHKVAQSEVEITKNEGYLPVFLCFLE